MNLPSRFLSTQLKIERAKHHVKDITEQINSYMAERPFRLVYRGKPKARNAALVTKTNKPIPQEFALIIGDAVHNLRSALDLTMYTLAVERSPSPQKIQFPFSFESEGLESAINNGQVKFAGEGVADAVRALKPYKGGNPELWGLQALDSSDKHRLPILAWRSAVITGNQLGALGLPFIGSGKMIFAQENDQHFIFTNETFGVSRKERRKMADFENETHVQPTYSICFGKGQPFENQSIIATLINLTGVAGRAVESLIEASLV
jgi:hypothetical protein